MEWIRKLKNGISFCWVSAMLVACNGADTPPVQVVEEVYEHAAPIALPTANVSELDKTIKIALLLDTSGSMDGLIEQAKSQLWKIVNQLALAKKGEDFAAVQIALYEYGNDNINRENGYVRQVVGLTDDLDEISKQLFALTTNGGSEYCGQVIAKSISELDWEEETGGLQVMFIGGNEEFTQGDINYETACANASKSDIIVNTIYCGESEEGVRTKWKHGADLTQGFYGTIEMDEATVYIETPFDAEIQKLNDKLNETYLAFGDQKDYYRENQTMQDANSYSYGSSNAVERTITKSSHLYKNEKWDLVDANKNAEFDLSKVDKINLPAEMQGMTPQQKQDYIDLKTKERVQILDQIHHLNQKRLVYIEQKKIEMGQESGGLDYAMMEAIKKQATDKNFTFESL